MTFQQTIKQEAERVDPLEPQSLKKVPNFYQGFSNSPYTSRFKNQEVNENFPFITEYLEGSVQLNSQGKNTDVVTFGKQIYDVPPIVEGMILQPDLPSANVLPIQTYWNYTSTTGGSTSTQTSPLFSGIGSINTNGLKFNIQTGFTTTEDFNSYGVLDSYPDANLSWAWSLNGTYNSIGQSFTTPFTTKILDSCQFFLRKNGTPGGNITASLYAHSGTYSSSGIPTGSPLATSDSVAASGLTTSFADTIFTFTGSNRITLAANTHYVIVVSYTGTAISYIDVGSDATIPTHGGNLSVYTTSWTPAAGYDACFAVYGVDAPVTTYPYANQLVKYKLWVLRLAL